jgi:hypothetical protein
MKKIPIPASAFVFLIFVCLMPISLQAHHGKDFILSQSAILPHPGDLYIIPKFNTVKSGDEYSTEIEPSALFGINHWLAFELHSHISNEAHGSFSYEATAPSLLLNLLSRQSGFNLGLSAEYEFSHSHHHPDNFESRLSASQSLGANLFAANLIMEKSPHSDTDLGFSISAKNSISSKLSLGVELQNSSEQSEVIAAILYNLKKQLDLNIGIGSGLDNEIDFTFYATLVWEL